MEEIWKDIPGYEGMYQVSNLGNVKSLPKYLSHFFGDVRLTKEKILKPGLNTKNNRFNIVLCSTKRKTFCVHQLVAMAFLNHMPNGYNLVVDHINNNPLDNRVENLQLVTQRINCSKDVKNKTSKYTGVSWDKSRNKWTSRISISKKIYCLGRFENEEKASESYEKALNSINNGEEIIIKKFEFTSKYKNIHFDKRINKWVATIRINEKQKCIGKYKTELEAYEAHKNFNVLI